MSEHPPYRYSYKASDATREFVEAVNDFATEDDADLIRAAVMFYVLDGWETYWPFANCPKWLQAKYWPFDALRRVKDAALQ